MLNAVLAEMSSVAGVELLEFAQCVQKVPLVPDQGPVEQLVAAGLHSPFHDRIHSRHLDPAEHDLDTRVLEHVVEQAGKFAVSVPEPEPRSAPCIFKIHDEVPRGLCDPGHSGVRVCAQDADPPAGVLDDRQDVQVGAARVISHTVEAAVLMPRTRSSPWMRGSPSRDSPCQAQHQLADGADGARPARAPGAGSGRVVARQEVPLPAQYRVRLDQQPELAEYVAWGAGAAGRPGTPGRPGRTAAGSCPVAIAAPRSAAAGSRSRTSALKSRTAGTSPRGWRGPHEVTDVADAAGRGEAGGQVQSPAARRLPPDQCRPEPLARSQK
jgi:hypothetical protein